MLKLKRAYLDNCTIGKLYFNGGFVCYTLERPWLNNEKNVSCVPAGIYDLSPYSSSKYHDSFSLTCHSLGVGMTSDYQRTYILIHPANYPDEIQGCIAPGLHLHSRTWGVSDSRVAMNIIRELIGKENIKQIEIS